MNSEGNTLHIVLALIALLGAGALVYAERTLPRAGPATAVMFHTDSLASGNLTDLRDSAITAVFVEYQTQASRPVFAKAEELYNERIPQIARPTWRKIRDRARAAAEQEYEALRPKVVSLGRQEYQRLSPDERRRVIESGGFDRFVFVSGVELLPPEEKNRFADADAFYRRQDKVAYMTREAWRHVSDEEREQLASPRSLSDEDTLEKLKYFDRVAEPNLEPDEQQMLRTVDREDVESLERFVSVHGERVLAERLAESPLTWASGLEVDCESHAFDRGALLYGPIARCQAASGSPSFVLSRGRFDWIVIGVSGIAVGPEV